MVSKRVRPFLLNLVCAGAVGSAIYFFINKQRELQEHSTAFQRSGYCGTEIVQLQNWCETNYFSWWAAPWRLINNSFQFIVPYLHGDKVKSIEEICQASRKDKMHYQHHLDAFFDRLDQKQELRQQLEEFAYSSEDEIIISVHYEQEEYRMTKEEDPSDPYYRRYLTDLSGDAPLQNLLVKLLDGKDVQADISHQVQSLLSTARPQNDLEKFVVETLNEKFQKNEIIRFLYESALYFKNEVKAETKVVAVLKENVSAYQAALIEQERIYRATSRLHGDTGSVLSEIEKTKQQITKKEQELIQKEHELQEVQKRRKQFQRRSVSTLWKELHQQLVRYRVQSIRPMIERGMIAYGHTHPLGKKKWKERREDDGPSPPDVKGSYAKPEIVVVTYADKWLIHQVICGESTLAREYPRSTK